MADQKLALTPYGAVPNARQMEWYRRGQTAFLHFTVNTFTDREWGDGTESPEELVEYWFRSAGRNSGILLNLPPDRRGLIHEKDAQAVIRWNDMMEAIFAEDLACQAVVTASGETWPGCGQENLTDAQEDTCYAPREKLGEVVLTFPEEITFDCFRLEETIELGHRVRGFSLDIRTETGWQEVPSVFCGIMAAGESPPPGEECPAPGGTAWASCL